MLTSKKVSTYNTKSSTNLIGLKENTMINDQVRNKTRNYCQGVSY